MNVLVLTPYLYDTVPGQRFRIEQWARIIEPQGVHFQFVPFESESLKQVLHEPRHHATKAKELMACVARRIRQMSSLIEQDRWDLIFLYRELLPIGPPLLERALSLRRIPIIYDFDDAIFLPDVSEANRRFQWLKWPQKTGEICRRSAHVTVGNRYLREYALRYTKQISVIPTTIDTDAYTLKGHVEIQGLPVIGWSGSLTTLKHLRTIEPVLKDLHRSVPFRLKVIGKSDYSLPGVEVESKAWCLRSELEDLKSFDIGIMPLPQDTWSLGKCGLKALQYMAVGVPTIASPVGVNSEIIQDGENGFIASSPKEWIEKVSLLLTREDLRAQFAREGRRTVEERYCAKVQAPRLLRIFEQVQGTRISSFKSPVFAHREADPRRRALSQEPQNILCFSSIDWDFLWQGHQEIMAALALGGHRVLFIENTGVRNLQLRDFARIWRRLTNWRKSLQGFRKIEENLYLFSPLVLPFPYWRLARWINQRLMASALHRWMRSMDFYQPICWTFLPTPLTLEVIRRIPYKALIYYCIDSFSDSTPAAHRILASEEALLRQADLVFVTSQKLFEHAARWNRQVHWFPFGVNFEAFQQVRSDSDGVPEELSGLRRPVVGYIGGIHQWVDQELFCRLAKAGRDLSFVLVGPAQIDVERLRREPNVILLGQRPHEELPRYVKQFDVGIIPYRLTEYTRNVYPTKLNEYHAMGKPVISTALPEVIAFNRRYGDLVKIAATQEEFTGAIQQALEEDTPSLRERRMSAARENGWSRRIEAMQELIRQAIVKRSAELPQDWADRLRASFGASRRIFAGGLFLALVFAVTLNTPLIWMLADPLRIVQPPQPADSIVVFAGGVGESGEAGEGYQERVKQAVDLYTHAYAPRVLLVSGYTWTFEEADIMQALIESLGVPREAILSEKKVHQTYDYVLRVKEIAAREGWKSILLVTSPYHARRADLTFAHNAPELKVIHAPVLESPYYARGWGAQPHQIRGILHEWIGIVYYWLKGWI